MTGRGGLAKRSRIRTVVALTVVGFRAPSKVAVAGVSGGKPARVLRKPLVNSTSAGDAVGLKGILSFWVIGSLARSVGRGTVGGVVVRSNCAVTNWGGLVLSMEGVQLAKTKARKPKVTDRFILWDLSAGASSGRQPVHRLRL